MLKLLLCILAGSALASNAPAQMLIADRAPESGAHQYLSLPAGTQGFLADDFQVGTANEDWVIDHIRLWMVPDPKTTSAHAAGELFTKIALFGGIAPASGPPGEVTCDCHNLPALRTAFFQPGRDALNTPGDSLTVVHSADGPDLWQIDLQSLKWSVPAAKPIQFGVLVTPRSGQEGATLYYVGAAADGDQHLRIFTSAGKYENPLAATDPGRINIQVWGHLLAKVSIRPDGDKLTIVLHSQSSVQASQIDPASLRFGPGKASPQEVHVVDRHDGQPDLVMSVSIANSGVAANNINACLDGKRLDGSPFEGCDLVPH